MKKIYSVHIHTYFTRKVQGRCPIRKEGVRGKAILTRLQANAVWKHGPDSTAANLTAFEHLGMNLQVL
jgi:hypothetical protein